MFMHRPIRWQFSFILNLFFKVQIQWPLKILLSSCITSEFPISTLTETEYITLVFFVHSSLHTLKVLQPSLKDHIRSQ